MARRATASPPTASGGGTAAAPSGAAGRPSRTEPARVLRRLEWLAAFYGLAEGLWLLSFRRSFSAALVLTLAAAASIVAFRGLQGLVGQLQAGTGEPDPGTPIDRRGRRLVWLRFSLLTLAPLASLWMDSERALALILGFSVLPLAIMTEGLLQLVFVFADRPHGR